MRLVNFSHRGCKRFGALLSGNRVLDLTHFFHDERVLRSAGEEGEKTVREAVERAQLRRSIGGHIYSLDEVVLETPPSLDAGGEDLTNSDGSPSDQSGLWGSCADRPPYSGFGIHLIRKMRAMRR